MLGRWTSQVGVSLTTQHLSYQGILSLIHAQVIHAASVFCVGALRSLRGVSVTAGHGGVFQPLTLVACEPRFEPDCDEFTETVPEMLARVEKDMNAEREAQREERIWQLQTDESKVTGMDTTPAPSDPASIPGTNLHVVTPQGVTMEDFSKSGQVTVDLTGSAHEQASTGNVGGQATKP